ncbi:MAG TPA: hypothetical protein VFL89_01455 [Solirubrobacterales bacterium]|nr:hypothetical protein [Solirubrobacterales bacterium]
MPRRPADGFAVPVVFALLVLATVAAFAWSQRLKRDPLVIDHVTFRAVNTGGTPDAGAGKGGEGGPPPPVPPAGKEGGAASKKRREPVRAFTPNGDCRNDRIRIRFRVTRSDTAIVQVVEPGGRLMITLARERYLKRYHFFTFYWAGQSRAGGTAPPGRYKLRVKLLGQDRTLVPPGAILLHRAAQKPLPGCKAAESGAAP